MYNFKNKNQAVIRKFLVTHFHYSTLLEYFKDWLLYSTPSTFSTSILYSTWVMKFPYSAHHCSRHDLLLRLRCDCSRLQSISAFLCDFSNNYYCFCPCWERGGAMVRPLLPCESSWVQISSEPLLSTLQ